MSDGNNGTPAANPVAAPANNAAPASGAPVVPAGFKQVSEQDYATFQRWGEQVKGVEALSKRFKDAGFDKPEDFDKYAPKFRAIKEKGYTPEHLDVLLGNVGYGEKEEKTSKAEFDPAQINELVEKAVNSRLGVHDAMRSHGEAVKATPDRLAAVAKSILGDKATESDIRRFAREIKAELPQEFYPKDHPLHDREYAPPSDESIKKAAESIKSDWIADKASEAVKKADSIRKAPVASAASPNTGGGKPEPKPHRNARDELDSHVESVMSG